MRCLKNLRRKFERFCYEHRNIGIPNLMLYVTLGSAIVYILSMFDQSYTLYNALCFDRSLIMRGQVWRLFTYVFTYDAGHLLITAIGLFCYYSLGRAMENIWGTLRFNLFYFSGVIMMDIFCMIFGGWADISYLNMSLFLGYATLFPDTRFLLFYIIPVKAWIFALVDLGLTLYSVIQLTAYGLFPYSLFPFVAIANYFLFFGKDVLNVIPLTWRINASRLFRKKPKQATGAKPIQFYSAGSYEASTARVKAPYTHRCTVCGRTDVSDPDLEFRYCSRCSGYHCYCEDHISNHTHIQ
jgi:membrane associated rhomboid family serine protease